MKNKKLMLAALVAVVLSACLSAEMGMRIHLDNMTKGQSVEFSTGEMYGRGGIRYVDLYEPALDQHIDKYVGIEAGDVFLDTSNKLIIFFEDYPDYFVRGTLLGHIDDPQRAMQRITQEDIIVEFVK